MSPSEPFCWATFVRGGGGRKHPTRFAMSRAVTSPNYFSAPGFISDPSLNSDHCIYPHLSQIRHQDTDNANAVGFRWEGSLQSRSCCSDGGRKPAILGLEEESKTLHQLAPSPRAGLQAARGPAADNLPPWLQHQRNSFSMTPQTSPPTEPPLWLTDGLR